MCTHACTHARTRAYVHKPRAHVITITRQARSEKAAARKDEDAAMQLHVEARGGRSEAGRARGARERGAESGKAERARDTRASPRTRALAWRTASRRSRTPSRSLRRGETLASAASFMARGGSAGLPLTGDGGERAREVEAGPRGGFNTPAFHRLYSG